MYGNRHHAGAIFMNQTEIIRADCLASSRKRYILKAQAEGSVDMAENAINMNISILLSAQLV